MTEINWSALAQQAKSAAAIIPPGDYSMQVVAAEYKTSTTGKPQYKLQLQVLDGPQQGRKVTTNLTLTVDNPVALRIFFRQMAAFGLDDQFFAPNPAPQQVAATLVQRTARVTLGSRTWRGEQQNEVDSIQPMIGGGAGLPGAPAAAPGLPTVPASPVVPQTVVPPAPAPVEQPVAAAPVAPVAPVEPVAPPVAEPVPQPVPQPPATAPEPAPVVPITQPQPVAQPVAPPIPEAPVAPVAPTGPPPLPY